MLEGHVRWWQWDVANALKVPAEPSRAAAASCRDWTCRIRRFSPKSVAEAIAKEDGELFGARRRKDSAAQLETPRLNCALRLIRIKSYHFADSKKRIQTVKIWHLQTRKLSHSLHLN